MTVWYLKMTMWVHCSYLLYQLHATVKKEKVIISYFVSHRRCTTVHKYASHK